MPILQEIAQKHNYLTDEAMVEVARELDISALKFRTASFYTFRHSGERQYVIRVCKQLHAQ